MEYRFFNATFPYKTTLSKVNIMTNTITSKKWTYFKNRIFFPNYFITITTVNI